MVPGSSHPSPPTTTQTLEQLTNQTKPNETTAMSDPRRCAMGARCLHTDEVPNVVCLGKCGARLHAGCALASRCEICYGEARADSAIPVPKRARTASGGTPAQRRMQCGVSKGGAPITSFFSPRPRADGGVGDDDERSGISMWDRAAAMAPEPAAAAAAAGSGGGMGADGAGAGAGSADVAKAKKKRQR